MLLKIAYRRGCVSHLNLPKKCNFTNIKKSAVESSTPVRLNVDNVDAHSDASREGSEYKFPWKSYKTPFTFKGLVSRYVRKEAVALMFKTNTDEEIIDGARHAFSTSVWAIFDQITKKSSDHIPKKDTITSLESPQDARRLCFESKLASFYDIAVNEFNKNASGLILFHELVDILDVYITDRDLIYGGDRKSVDACVGPIGVVRTPLGVFVKDTEAFAQTRTSTDPEIYNADELWTVKKNFLTIRFTVDIVCREIFCIKQESSGKVVQGTEMPSLHTHQLIIESTLKYNRDKGETNAVPYGEKLELVDDWTVVDIDGWLDGNLFWEEGLPP